MNFQFISFRPDESALSLWNRLSSEKFHVSNNAVVENDARHSSEDFMQSVPSTEIAMFPIKINNHLYELKFHESYEVQADFSEVSETVLSLALEFASKYENGLIIHLSTGNNLFRSLQQSGINLSNVPLYSLHRKERVKAVTVHNIIHLIATFELLKQTLRGETVLLLFEEMLPLLLIQKSFSGILSNFSQINSLMKILSQLQQMHSVISLWVNSSLSKISRNPSDPFFTIWKQKMAKVLQF